MLIGVNKLGTQSWVSVYIIYDTTSMLLLEGLGACPPEKFVKKHALRSNLRAFQGQYTSGASYV